MKKEIYIIISAALIAIIIVLVYWIKLIQSKIDYTFNVTKVYTKDLMLSDLVTGKLIFRLDSEIDVKNNSKVTIPIRNFKIYLYYKDSLIAQSTKSTNFKINKLTTSRHTESIQCIVNENAIELSKYIINQKAIGINYTITGNILFIPFKYSDVYTII